MTRGSAGRERETTRRDLALLDGLFDERTVRRGLALHRERAVKSLAYDPDEPAIEARVQGSRRTPYAVSVSLGEDDEVIEALCSCPVGVDCKHAVAAFLAHRASVDEDTGPEPGGRPNRRAGAGATGPSAEDVSRHRLDDWLRRLEAAGGGTSGYRSGSPASRSVHHRLYVLEPIASHDASWGAPRGKVSAGASLCVREAPRTHAGHYGKGRRHHPRGHLAADTLIDALDEEIAACGAALASRAGGPWYEDSGRYALVGRLGATMLELAIESGRAFVGDDRQRPLERGAALAPLVDWVEDGAGGRSLRVRLDGLGRWWALATDPPMYLDPEARRAGPLSSGLSGAQFLLALERPTVPAGELQSFGEALEEVLENVGTTRDDAPDTSGEDAAPAPLLPLPVELDTERVTTAPAPVLFLYSPDDDPHVDTWVLALIARYGEALLGCDPLLEEQVSRVTTEDGRRLRVRRDRDVERRWFFELMTRYPELTPQRASTDGMDTDGMDTDGADADPASFRTRAPDAVGRFRAWRRLVASRDALVRDGWQLIVLPPVHTDVVRPRRFQARVDRDDDAPGWFDVALGFEHEGVRHDLIPLVVAWLERGGGDEPLMIEHVDGRFLEVPSAALEPVAAVLDELGQGHGGPAAIRLSRARALALERLQRELGGAGIDTDWRGERELIGFARQLRALAAVDTAGFADTPVPRALKATLRPYQRVGLGWLNALARHDLCGILADDMGLGKTVQTLAHLLWLRSARRLDGPALVVAPTSLLGNWSREAARFAPRLRVRVWHGADRHERALADEAPAADLVVTSYGLALRDRDLLAGHGFGLLVLDEAQQIRNPAAKTTRAVKSLPVRRRLCLSGTPLENHLGELWSQFDFLMPGLLGDAARFTRHYRTPIERHGDEERQRKLAEAVRPFLLRRRKEAVATELPAKSEIVREVRLGGAQATLYESIRIAMQARVRQALERGGVERSRITVLDSLLKLRQLCCHPELVKLPSARRVSESAKTTVLLDMLGEMIAAGRRVLVFSQFTSMLSILERELAARALSWVKLTGQTRKRDEVIDRFQRGEVPLFLISLKAGGTGLNLTAADTVIHHDPWWNPAAEEQASARAHRIGQDKPVFVYRLVTAGTVEERILDLQARKRRLAEAMLERGDAGALASMSAEETLSLFEPLPPR